MKFEMKNSDVKNFNTLCEVDMRKMIISAAHNEGYIKASQIRLLDGEIRSMYFEYEEGEAVRCVVRLIDVVLRSPDVGVEELGSVNLVDNLDGEGFKYAF